MIRTQFIIINQEKKHKEFRQITTLAPLQQYLLIQRLVA